MHEWTGRLARAYAYCRAAYPEDRALLVVDVDGTLLDEGDRPVAGVVDVVRWFQAQPFTAVALATGRPEADREATRRALDRTLGREYRLSFDPDLVHMRPDGAGDGVDELAAHKLAGLRRFHDAGHRIVAVIDSDAEVVAALGDGDGDVLDGSLLLPTAALLATRRPPPPDRAAWEPSGHVELVWHRVNDRVNLRQFLSSPVRWGEIDVRVDGRGRLVLSHDDPDQAPALRHRNGDGDADGRDAVGPDELLEAFRAAGKGVNIDVKDREALPAVLAAVADHGFPGEDLWINGRVDELGEDGFRAVRSRFPDTRLQCPIDFLGPVAAAMPGEARRVLVVLQAWGLDRFSLAWTHPDTPLLRDRLDGWGLDVNLYAVTDLEQFLAGVLTLPRSLTADLTLPEWHYFGRGAGNDGKFHRDPEAAATSPGIDMAEAGPP